MLWTRLIAALILLGALAGAAKGVASVFGWL